MRVRWPETVFEEPLRHNVADGDSTGKKLVVNGGTDLSDLPLLVNKEMVTFE